MRTTFLMSLAVVLCSGLPVFACDGGGCEGKDKAVKEIQDGCCADEAKAKAKPAAPVALKGDGCCAGEKAKPAPVAAKGDDCCQAEGAAAKAACGTDCSDAKKVSCGEKLASMPLSKQVARLQTGAKKGCTTSAEGLSLLVKYTGVKSFDELNTAITGLETKAAEGCAESKAKLAKLAAAVQSRFPSAPLSARYTKLIAAAKKGCEKSGALLASMKKASGVECEVSLGKSIGSLEAMAAKGCAKSKAKLASLEAAFTGQAAPAAKESCEDKAKAGCEGEKAKAKAGCEGGSCEAPKDGMF